MQHGSRKHHVSVYLIPHGHGASVSFMEARLADLEDRLRQTEEVLVQERLARQTAEASHRRAGFWSAKPCWHERDRQASDVPRRRRPKRPVWKNSFVPMELQFPQLPRAVRPGRDQIAAASWDYGVGSNGCRQHKHDRGGKETFDTAVLRARLDLQRQVAAGGVRRGSSG